MRAALVSVTINGLHSVRMILSGPQALAFLPAIVLGAFWIGGEPMLIAAALGVPVLLLVAGSASAKLAAQNGQGRYPDTINITDAASIASHTLFNARDTDMFTACILIDVDGLDTVSKQSGAATVEALRELTLSRLRNGLRSVDQSYRIGDNRFVAVLGPSPRLDLEAVLQLCTRLQTNIEEPTTIDSASCYLSASLGFCTSNRLDASATGADMVEFTQMAITEAVNNGPSAIRAWSEGLKKAHATQMSLVHEVEKALQNGQIQPWFQPQICTSTGEITGVEALARWIHPDRGIIPPAQFLNCLEQSGQMGRLGEVILLHSLTALRGWDKAGLDIPRVSVNFSDPELRDPKLVDKISWELDRFGLTAMRLGIEILETVIADTHDGVVARNISELSELGCHIDLDDFGTGHASIAALRRFKVNRLKIDRSFVTHVDRDEEQRRMLAAVLGMADRLELETIAEGVESVGEHALLSQLGCDHVQGFGIARPMQGTQIQAWALDHLKRIASAQNLGRESG